jgi:CDP-glycerol glycerophosphotransferase (TagB/SpsB family)
VTGLVTRRLLKAPNPNLIHQLGAEFRRQKIRLEMAIPWLRQAIRKAVLSCSLFVFRFKEWVARLLAGTAVFPDLQVGLWLFIDRDTLADDNAEHFYSFLEDRGHQKPRYFVISATSPDWDRLRRNNLRLIKYGSIRMHVACLRCSHLFSSQADAYVARMAIQGKRCNRSMRYVFLQHGILHHNLSEWLNKRPVDLMVTSNYAERAALCDPSSGYRLAPSAVLLTGLPRHDALLQRTAARPAKDCLLVAPTWRKYLFKPSAASGGWSKSEENLTNLYFQQWHALLSSTRFQELAARLGCRIVLVMHPRMRKLNCGFGELRDVQVFQWGQGNGIQDLLCRAAVAITDYSSLVFDAALAGADIIYYQFDNDTFFSGAHSCRRGFFDYQRNGLGSVCAGLPEVEAALHRIAEHGVGANPLFEERKKAFFAHRDGRNCERLLAVVEAVDAGACERANR